MSDIRISDTPIFEKMVAELAARGIVYEQLLTPKFTPAPGFNPSYRIYNKTTVEETPTMASEWFGESTNVKPLWVIDDEE